MHVSNLVESRIRFFHGFERSNCEMFFLAYHQPLVSEPLRPIQDKPFLTLLGQTSQPVPAAAAGPPAPLPVADPPGRPQPASAPTRRDVTTVGFWWASAMVTYRMPTCKHQRGCLVLSRVTVYPFSFFPFHWANGMNDQHRVAPRCCMRDIPLTHVFYLSFS